MDKNSFLAYIAGFIDGEGCILLSKHKCKKSKRGFEWKPMIKITNSDKHVLLLIQKVIGGYIDKGQISNIGRKRVYQLVLNSSNLRKYLDKIIPLLIIKKKRAKLLKLALDETINHRKSSYNVSDVDIKLEKIYHKIKELNH